MKYRETEKPHDPKPPSPKPGQDQPGGPKPNENPGGSTR